MSHPLHEEINQHLISLASGELRSMPDWKVILEAIQLAEMEASFENVRYVTWLYYAIDDLFKNVKTSWITFTEIDVINHTLALVKHDMYTNKVGQFDSEPTLFKPDLASWHFLYAGKSLDELNKSPATFGTNKLTYEFIEKSGSAPMDNDEAVLFYLNNKQFEESYKTAFSSVINKKMARINFEGFIGRIQTTGEFSRKFEANREINHPEQILNIFIMPEFVTQVRKTYETKYVNVSLKDKSRLQEVQIVLSNLSSAKKVNITKNKETEITAYPDKFYTAEELNKDITSILNVVFAGRPSDPIIKDDVLNGISESIYRKILNQIYYFGKNVEKLSSLYKFDEEGFRDYFLPYLNMMSQSYTTTGETYNLVGKTDILIQNQNGENVFIAEFKVWSGQAEVNKAVDQLLERYTTWRDEKLALVIFNKSVQDFSGILNKAIEILQKHALFIKYVGKTKDSCASFIFRHPQDPNKQLELELVMFNCYVA